MAQEGTINQKQSLTDQSEEDCLLTQGLACMDIYYPHIARPDKEILMDKRDDIIYVLFDNWCNSEHESEVKEAMDRAIKNPTEDTIFQAISTSESVAFKAGAGTI